LSLFAIVLAVPALYLGTVSAYLLLLTAGSYRYRKTTDPNAAPLRIAVLTPAHNEERQIGAVIERVFVSDYPRDRFDVFVIADNCTDSTARCAKRAGAFVFERTDKLLRGKGQALDWCLKKHYHSFMGYDAVALVDADTMVSPQFLAEVSASLSHPDVQVMQGWYGVSNPDAGWRTALTWAGFALINGLRPAGRCHWGGTADIKGSGMAFRTQTLLEYGWPANSLVEDIDFSIRLLYDGIRVYFNPDAAVISEMPTLAAHADSQRRRWESGRLQTVLTYAPPMLSAFVRSLRWRYLDMVLELCVPPLSLLVFFELVCLAVSPVAGWKWSAFFIACIASTTYYVVAGLRQRNAPRTVWMGLLAVPLFLIWKVPFYLRLMIGKKQDRWERTKRAAEIEGDET